MTAPSVTVILSTYNQPDWLAKALWGYAAQDVRDFEVIVADDGSREDTRRMIDALRGELPFALRHVWHEDRGFRKCEILNKALVEAHADYLLFSDGDCVPRADFVRVHLRQRRPGRFLSGGYTKLPRALSQAITREDIAAGRPFDWRWLRAQGMPGGRQALKLASPPLVASLLNRLSPARASWNGHNASGWKADIVRVNGFDERMEYGGEDRELGERLENAGVRGVRIRFSAVCVHLDHDRGYVREEKIAANRAIRVHTRATRRVWTEHGIVKAPAPAQAA